MFTYSQQTKKLCESLLLRAPTGLQISYIFSGILFIAPEGCLQPSYFILTNINTLLRFMGECIFTQIAEPQVLKAKGKPHRNQEQEIREDTSPTTLANKA